MTLKNLLKSNNHYGYLINKSSSKSFAYLYGIRNNRCIINLNYTIVSLKRSLLLIKNFIKQDKIILIVCNDFRLNYLNRFIKNKNIISSKWEEGFLTKQKTNKISLIILFNLKNNDIILKESKICKIPIISIIDTNKNPGNITYPVLTNENNLKSLFLLIFFFKKIL